MSTGKIIKRSIDTVRSTKFAGFLWDESIRGFGAKFSKSGAVSYVLQPPVKPRDRWLSDEELGVFGNRLMKPIAVVTDGKAERYGVLPHQAGLVQLLLTGAIQKKRSRLCGSQTHAFPRFDGGCTLYDVHRSCWRSRTERHALAQLRQSAWQARRRASMRG